MGRPERNGCPKVFVKSPYWVWERAGILSDQPVSSLAFPGLVLMPSLYPISFLGFRGFMPFPYMISSPEFPCCALLLLWLLSWLLLCMHFVKGIPLPLSPSLPPPISQANFPGVTRKPSFLPSQRFCSVGQNNVGYSLG